MRVHPAGFGVFHAASVSGVDFGPCPAMGAGDQLKSRHRENGINGAFGDRARGASGASAHMLNAWACSLVVLFHGKTRGDSGGKSRVRIASWLQ